MSAIEDVISALQIVADQLGEAATAAGSASVETAEAMSHAVALGASRSVAELTALQDGVTKLTEQVAAAVDAAGEALERARGIASEA